MPFMAVGTLVSIGGGLFTLPERPSDHIHEDCVGFLSMSLMGAGSAPSQNRINCRVELPMHLPLLSFRKQIL